ncbi:MAG: hypothetical protein BYD32DRAFT_411574 [Podila humilis]|nr:MAG: hypothetical protein BYD32DRAFT_411574 [Podila humilis]
MTVAAQDQHSSDAVDAVDAASTKDQLEYNGITATAFESAPSKQISPSVATNSGAPSSSQTTSKVRGIALQDNNTPSMNASPQQWSGLDDEAAAQDESMSSTVRSILPLKPAATAPTKRFNPFLVQGSEPKSRESSAPSVALSNGQDTVDDGEGERDDEVEATCDNERELHSDYSSGTSTPTLARNSPSDPPSPSTRPMTRSTSNNQFLASHDRDDEHDIHLMGQRGQQLTTPTHRGSGQPQPVKRNHIDLWGRAYYEPVSNSSLSRTPSKKRNAQGKPIRFMSPPGRSFDPLIYDPLTQYKLKIPRLSDQEDNNDDDDDDDDDDEQEEDEYGPSSIAQEEEGEGDSFRTPKRKRSSRLPLTKLKRPFRAQSYQASEQGQDEHDLGPGVYLDSGLDPHDDKYLDEGGPYDEDPEEEDPAEEEKDLQEDQEGAQSGNDPAEEITQELKDQDDASEDEVRPSIQNTPNKYGQRDRLLLDLTLGQPSHFPLNHYQTPPRKTTARDHFDTMQPPPAPRVPDWLPMFSQQSDRQSKYDTPGWTGSQAGDSPSRNRSLRTPSLGSILGSSKISRN